MNKGLTREKMFTLLLTMIRVITACLVSLIALPVNGQDCTLVSATDPSKAVRGLLKAEWDKLYKQEKLGCPLSVETPLSDRSGAYQDFERGSIAHSPEPTAPNAIQAAYYSDEPSCANPALLKRNACVVLRWHDMPPGTFFRITFANAEYPGQPESGEQYSQTLVNVAAQQVFTAPVLNLDYTVLSTGVSHNFLYLRTDEPLTSTSGAIGWAISKDVDVGRYRFAVESCVGDQDGNGKCSARSNFVYVDFDMLALDPDPSASPKADDPPELWQAKYEVRRKEALKFACRFGNQASVSWRSALATPKQFDAEFGRTAFAMMELGDGGCPNRTSPDQVKTDYKTSLWWAEDPIMSLHLGCSGVPNNFSSECEVLLALRNLKQLTETGTDVADTKRDINDAFETGFSIAGAVLGGIGGAISGGAAGLVAGAIGGFFAGKALPPPCRPSEIIKGDYDMSLVWAVRFAYLYAPPPALQLDINPKMDVRTWEHLRELLSVRGPVNMGDQAKDICGLVSTPETENHILMTESSRYLTNQLLYLDGIRRGEPPDYSLIKRDYDLAIIRRLQRVLIEDFYEFNSTPYQRLTVYAIRNLRDFSFSHDVRVAAEAVLFYLDAKYAMSSNGMRRFAPFRRQDPRKNYGWLVGGKSDQEFSRLALLVGPGTVFHGDVPPDLKHHAYGPGDRYGFFSPQTIEAMVFHAVGPQYTVHPIIRDYFVLNRPFLDRSGGFLQRFKHSIPEVYFQSSRFLISAGGYAADSRLSWTEELFGDEDSSPRATTLMLSQERVDVADMIRFEGFFDKKDRNNLCVVDNFACGMNPVIPASIPEACKSRQGFWTFINFNSSSADCYRPYGVHIAVYARECDRRKECAAGGDRWGLLEAVDAEPVNGDYQSQPRVFQENDAFQRFIKTVLDNNPQALSDGWSQAIYANAYRRIIGQPITFSIFSDKGAWQILSVGNELTQQPKDWALAEGRVMRSLKGQACVEINNFWRNERLVLELRDELSPRICVIRPAELPPSCQDGVPVVC